MDLSSAVVPKSDQLNSDDLYGSPRTFTITDVRPGNDEQPVNIYLAEFPKGRPWKPNKTMCRVLMELWGPESSVYIGRRVTLFREPKVKFGNDLVGGVRISHMSDIGTKKRTVIVTVSKGRKGPIHIEPLSADAPSSPPVSEESVARLAELRAEWPTATEERRAEMLPEMKALATAPASTFDADDHAQAVAADG